MCARESNVWPKAAFAVGTLGLAKAAIDALKDIAKKRILTQGIAPSARSLAYAMTLDGPRSPLRTAERLFANEGAHCCDRLNAFETLTEVELMWLGQSCSFLADTSRQIVQTMCKRLSPPNVPVGPLLPG